MKALMGRIVGFCRGRVAQWGWAKRVLVAMGLVALSGVMVVGVGFWVGSRHYWNLRREWAGEALPMMVCPPDYRGVDAEEAEQLLRGIGSAGWGDWMGERVLVMRDGAMIDYRFWHGANSGLVDHLFLGRGSDGRWLFSTYHFCNGLAAVRGEEAPDSIEDFMQRYSVREFAGAGDERCLEHTWP